MIRLGVLLVVVMTVLLGCAPSTSRSGDTLRAAFSSSGVVVARGGQVVVATAPTFRPQTVRVPGAPADVAWQGGDAWVALPTAGWVQRLTGRPDVIEAGRAVVLSSTRIYREDGTALTYEGRPTGGVTGTPAAAVTGGDGRDYVLLAGKLYRVDTGRVLADEKPDGPYLFPTPDGADTAAVPTAVTRDSTYRLSGGKLQRVDATGVVRAEVSHGPGLIGIVAEFVVTVSPEGVLRVFRYDLTEVRT